MKKITGIILSAILVFGLCACGSSNPPAIIPDTVDSEAAAENAAADGAEDATEFFSVIDEETADMESIKKVFDKASAFVESLIDPAEMDVSTDDEQMGSMYRYWNLKEEPEKKALSTEVEVDGNKLYIGQTRIRELDGRGFEFEYYVDTVGPDDMVSVTLVKGGKNFLLSTSNYDTEDPIPVTDCLLYGFNSGTDEFSLPFNYNGITNESTFEDVLNILGVPNAGINLDASTDLTLITMTYFNETQNGNKMVADNLVLTFLYDAEQDEATLRGISFGRSLYETETAE